MSKIIVLLFLSLTLSLTACGEDILVEEAFVEKRSAGGIPATETLVEKMLFEEPCMNQDPVVIMDVNHTQLLKTFLILQAAVDTGCKPIVHVSGEGGAVQAALAFFDLMRTSGVSKHTTFISSGSIWSASNIVWLAAEKRVVTPGSAFFLHEFTLNLQSETHRVRNMDVKIKLRTTAAAVLEATSNQESADKWRSIAIGDKQGIVLDAENALSWGWATEIKPYQ